MRRSAIRRWPPTRPSRSAVRRWRPPIGPFTSIRLGAAVVAWTRLARAARLQPPIRPADRVPGAPSELTVVVPARDEADRIDPLLAAVVGAPGVCEVVVVDDGSRDATAARAAAAGARVVAGAPLPPGWTGKAWALHQGIATTSTDWVVTLDADARPDPALPQALVARAHADGHDLLTVAGRFDCPTAGARWLHPALLTTLVYRFGPPGSARPVRPARAMANGQCMTIRRAALLAEGGLAPVAAQPVEDVALARHLAARGRVVGFLDASEMLRVRMYEDLAGTWRGWSRSLALSGVEPTCRQLGDLVVVLVAQVLPLWRLLARRGDWLDVALAATRLGTLGGTARAYRPVRGAYWLSPLADPLAAAALAAGILRCRQRWRGREYVTTRPPARTAAR